MQQDALSFSRLPVVAIVGRPNVGKSSLFNRLVGSRIAIEDPIPGTTRDRVSFRLRIGERQIELIDAAGMGIIDEDRLETQVESQIRFAIDQADILLFVVDIKEGILPLDQRVADVLRRSSKKVILVANKADVSHQESMVGPFFKLGIADPICVSAKEQRNIDLLQELIVAGLPERVEGECDTEPTSMKLAIVGKRNSGKSSLVNFLAKDDRVIVSEIPGTTRDSIDVRFEFKGMTFTAIDTAGIQRDRSVKNSVEFFSQARSTKAMRRADVIVLMMDCEEQTSKLDRKLAEEAILEVKPIVIAVNKWDLAGHVNEDTFNGYIESKLPMLRFAPVVYMSVKNGENCLELVETALKVHQQSYLRVTTGQLNRSVQRAFDRHRPKSRYGKPPKLFYATQVEVNPVTIVVFVNDHRIFRDDWREYLKARLREDLPFKDIPLKVVFKNRDRVDITDDQS